MLKLKTQFVDTGKITDSEFTEIVDSAGGRSAYATWLTKQVVSKNIKPEDLYKYNAYFKIFDRRKREYPFNDINQYKTTDDISQFITKSVSIWTCCLTSGGIISRVPYLIPVAPLR